MFDGRSCVRGRATAFCSRVQAERVDATKELERRKESQRRRGGGGGRSVNGGDAEMNERLGVGGVGKAGGQAESGVTAEGRGWSRGWRWMDWQVRVVGEGEVMQRRRVHAASAAAAAEDRAQQSGGLDATKHALTSEKGGDGRGWGWRGTAASGTLARGHVPVSTLWSVGRRWCAMGVNGV
jgi:hypothetical protein